MQKFHSEDREVLIGNKMATVHIICEYDYDSEPPNVEFESDEENQKYYKRFETGEISNLECRVTAIFNGESAFDYLGGIHIVSNNMETELLDVIRGEQLIDNAVNNLVISLTNTYQILKGYFE